MISFNAPIKGCREFLMSEVNKAIIVRLYEEGFNLRQLDILDEIVDGGFLEHDPTSSEPARGPKGVKQSISYYWAAFPNLHFTVEDLLAEADKVVIRWKAHGTHHGELMGIPATGRQIMTTGISVYSVTHGKIVEEWSNWDILGTLRQLEDGS